MPYKLSEIAASHGVSYLPIVSSGRAFRALWKRAYSKAAEWLAAVVYEDPWLAGGHNGLSNAEDPTKPEDPYPRVKALRDTMREGGISDDVPIVMAGGVWYLRDWSDWIDNPELGAIAFQFGTRPGAELEGDGAQFGIVDPVAPVAQIPDAAGHHDRHIVADAALAHRVAQRLHAGIGILRLGRVL